MRLFRKSVRRSKSLDPDVRMTVDGRPVFGIAGQSVLGALWAQGIKIWRVNPVGGQERAGFCGMGVCFECEIDVAGTAERRACMIPATEGLVIRTGIASQLSGEENS